MSIIGLRASVAVASFASLFLAPSLAAAESLEDMVAKEASNIAKAFDVTPAITLKDRGGYKAENGVVFIDLTRLRADLEKTETPLRVYRLRWILGHEIWHVAQFRDYKGQFPASDPQFTRLFECQADMMGAYFAGQTSKHISSVDDDWLSYSAAAQSIGNLADDLTDQTMSMAPGGHPDADQRQMAVFYGMVRAFAEHIKENNLNTDDGLLEKFNGSVEIQANEDVRLWSYRLCEKIIHVDTAAASALVLKDDSPPWPKENFAGTFLLRYANTSDRSIRAKLSVIFAIVSLDGNDIPPVPLESREFEFELRPGATQTLSGILGLDAPMPGARVSLIYPRRQYIHYTLFSAKFVDDTMPATPSASVALADNVDDLRPSARLLHSLLPDLAFDAVKKFSNFESGVCSDFVEEKLCPVNFVFPGALESTLTLTKSGEAYIDSDLYEGNNRVDAVKVFQELVNDLRAVYPGIKIPQFDINKKNPRVEVDLSKHASLEVYMSEPGKYSDQYRTSVRVNSNW